MDLSIILTAHSEGILAHKTMLSVFRALESLDKAKIKYEILIHLDHPDAATADYFARYQEDQALLAKRHIVIYRNDFGDISLARNFCTQKAKGRYLAFADADDLISRNYFLDAVKKLDKSSEKQILHPEYCISFMNHEPFFECFRMLPSERSRRANAYNLLDTNRWISAAVAPRELFEAYPYRQNQHGYGHEDFTFNIQTIDAGIKHSVVAGSAYFYRRRNSSLRMTTNAQHLTEPYAKMFDFSNFNFDEAALEERAELKPRLEERLVQGYKRVRSNRYVSWAVAPAAALAHKLMRKNPVRNPWKNLPKALRDEWVELSDVETSIFPVRYKTRQMIHYTPEKRHSIGIAYAKIVNHKPEHADYVFIVPWMRVGGADKVVLNYLQAFKEIYPQARVAVITTLANKNAWAHKMPDNSFLLEYGNYIDTLDAAQRDALFTRIITQLQAKAIHIVNSEYGYRWASAHATLIKANYHFNLSLFCYDIIPDTEQRGRFDYADPYAVEVYDFVDNIYTDNSCTKRRLVAHEGFLADKIHVELQPANMLEVGPKTDRFAKDHKRHVLWASRVCAQKNPEVIAEIAKRLDRDVVIDVYGKMEPYYNNSLFAGADNVVYHGAFNGISSLNPQDYDAFLYTSLVDGLPNILLEIAQFEIPIVTANAGGAGDFISNNQTGILIEDAKDAQAYADGLKRVLGDAKFAAKLVKQAKQRVDEQHSWQSYLDTIKQDFKQEK